MFGQNKDAPVRDPSRIDIENDVELAHWIEIFRTDEATLRGAIQAVGFAAADVRDYFKWREAAHP